MSPLGDGMRHILRPVENRGWAHVAHCSCGWAVYCQTPDEARAAANAHDMDDAVWLDRADAKVIRWRYTEPDA